MEEVGGRNAGPGADCRNLVKRADGKTIDAPGKPMSPSALAAEIAYRKRKDLPPFTDEQIEALKAGTPMPAASETAATPAASPGNAAPVAESVATPTETAAAPSASGPAAPSAPAATGVIGGLPPLPR